MFVNAIAAMIGKPFLAASLKNSLLDWAFSCLFCFSILFVLGYISLSSSVFEVVLLDMTFATIIPSVGN